MPRVASSRGNWDCLTCPICKLSCKSSLQQHIIGVHERSGEFRCSECGERFQYASRLERHLTIHTRNEEHKCDHCSASFRKLRDMHSHREKRHSIVDESNKLPYGCSNCGESFRLKKRFLRHKCFGSVHAAGQETSSEYIDRDRSNGKRKQLSDESESAEEKAPNRDQVGGDKERSKTKMENWETGIKRYKNYDYPVAVNQMKTVNSERNVHNRTGGRVSGGCPGSSRTEREAAELSGQDENWTTGNGQKLKVVYDVDYQQPD